jgi:hypothetical protein
MSHLDEGRLTALQDNELTAAERAAAEAHLATCEQCRRLLEELKDFATEADGLVASLEPPPSRGAAAPPRRRAAERPRWRNLAWAATVILALGLGWVASDVRMVSRQPAALGDRGFDSAPPGPAREEPATRQQQAAGPPREQAEDKIARTENRAKLRLDRSPADRPSQPAPAAVPAPSVGAMRDAAADLDIRGNAAALSSGKAVAAPAPAAAPAPTAGALEAAATGAVAQGRAGAFRQVKMEEAVRTLSGSIRLVDGLEPERVLIGPGESVPGADPAVDLVRVVYEDPPGRELWLDQQRPPEAEAGRFRGYSQEMLVGDTVVTRGSGGSTSLRWIDQHGFRLALTGFLGADSLRSIVPRVH